MKHSKIKYDSKLTPEENAKKNGVSLAGIRYYIKENQIDRKYDRKIAIIEKCKAYLHEHPTATRTDLHDHLGFSLSTIRKYWANISTEEELIDFDSNKAKRRQLRQYNDFYATHPSCVQDLLREEEFSEKVLEPFCGSGSVSRVLIANGYDVHSSDLIDRGFGDVADFFKTDFPVGMYDIVSNPPYKDGLTEIVEKCLAICKSKVALLYPITHLSGLDRYLKIYKKTPPQRVYLYVDRICIAKNADFEKYDKPGANKDIYAWFVWDKKNQSSDGTILKWLRNDKKTFKW